MAARQLVFDQVTALAQSKLRSTLDVSFANVNLSDAKLLQVQAQNDVQAAEADLAEAMGLPGQPGFTLEEEPLPASVPDRVDDLLRQALNNRPELKDLRLEESAAQRFTKAEHALYYPSIGVLGTAGLRSHGLRDVASRYGAIGLNVNIPIFNGGLFKARQTEAELKAQGDLEKASAIWKTASPAMCAWHISTPPPPTTGMALTKQLLDQAQLALDLAQSRYDLGLAGSWNSAQRNST